MKTSPLCIRDIYENRRLESLPTFFEYESHKLGVETFDDRITIYVPTLQYSKDRLIEIVDWVYRQIKSQTNEYVFAYYRYEKYKPSIIVFKKKDT